MKASPKPGSIFSETAEEDIPSALIHDIIDGNLYCYKGYRDILAGKEHISSRSGFSMSSIVICNYLLTVLFKGTQDDRNIMVARGPGLYINEKNVLTAGIVIFERSNLPMMKTTLKYHQKLCWK